MRVAVDGPALGQWLGREPCVGCCEHREVGLRGEVGRRECVEQAADLVSTVERWERVWVLRERVMDVAETAAGGRRVEALGIVVDVRPELYEQPVLEVRPRWRRSPPVT
jgi:hypothetical protein